MSGNKTTVILAKRIKACREAKGLSHARLSEALEDQFGIEISKASLINYEVAEEHHTRSGANIGMSVKNLVALARFYDVSVDWLLGLSEIPTPGPMLRAACEYTGLSSISAQRIKKFGYGDILSQIIEDMAGFGAVMTAIGGVLDCKRTMLHNDNQDAEKNPEVQKLLQELRTYGYDGKPLAYFMDDFRAKATRAFGNLIDRLDPDWKPSITAETEWKERDKPKGDSLF